jgi:hypothetical protein
MALIAVKDGTSTHTGSTVAGPVAGTLTEGSNSFFTIEGQEIVVEDGTMEIPSHQYQVMPPLFHSHSFSPDTIAQSFFTIEGNKIVQVGDSYSSDPTSIDGAGSNSFMVIT